MGERERLEQQYRAHHEANRSPEFVFCGPERRKLFGEIVGGPGKRVLDLGCRTGALTRAYSEGNEVVGVDIDREAMAQASADLGIETVWADVDEPLPFPDASFDVAVAGELLEHVRHPALLVAEVARVLRPGGTFVASTPNGFRLKSRLRFLVGKTPEFADDPTHLRIYSEEMLADLFGGWVDLRIRFVAGRLVPLHPRLFANDIVVSARRPG
jgi:SAM-dependent methyltransferase